MTGRLQVEQLVRGRMRPAWKATSGGSAGGLPKTLRIAGCTDQFVPP
jgi:hypothetical protein